MIITTISGNLVRNPELRSVGEEKKKVCVLGVASNRFGKEKPDVLRVEVWGIHAENCAKYLKKGSGVCATGDLTIDLYDKDGETRTSVALTNARVEFNDRLTDRTQN